MDSIEDSFEDLLDVQVRPWFVCPHCGVDSLVRFFCNEYLSFRCTSCTWNSFQCPSCSTEDHVLFSVWEPPCPACGFNEELERHGITQNEGAEEEAQEGEEEEEAFEESERAPHQPDPEPSPDSETEPAKIGF